MKASRSPSAKSIIDSYFNQSSSFWLKRQRVLMMRLFRAMKSDVSAYRSFLKKYQINGKFIQTYQDLARIPPADKNHYFNRYGLKDTAWNRRLKDRGMVFTSTSGSTGLPTYFARNDRIDWQYSILAEFFLRNGPAGSSLLIDCFGMGVWIGGLITYQAFRYAALRGWPISILTPGINKKEIFHSLRELAPRFDNLILAGYPPFLKDILDEAPAEKINFRKFHTRLLFAAESFTETFRDYVAQRALIKNIYHDTLNIYGSAELGAMAFETPLSILVRRQALKHPAICRQLFTCNRLPTLAQYNPEFITFSAEHGDILISADNITPFMKYRIGDSGGVYSLSEIEQIFSRHGLNLALLAKRQKIRITTLPFVYVYERSDLSTKLYGAIIYPQHIREALLKPALTKSVTGKFHMATKTDGHHNQFLQINVELGRGSKRNQRLVRQCRKLIIESLLKNNAEYKNNYHTIPHKVAPRILLWPRESPNYFKPGIKQSWVNK